MTTKIRTCGSRDTLAGFTLLEMLVVLTITAAVMVLAVASYRSRRPDLRLISMQLSAQLAGAREAAIAEDRPVAVVIGPGNRSLRFRYVLSLPEGVKMVFFPIKGIGRTYSTRNVIFFPDGSSTGGLFKLADGSKIATVQVEWLSGMVSRGRAR